MKRFLGILLCVLLVVCSVFFVGCSSNQDLLKKIEDLQSQIDNMSGSGNSSAIQDLLEKIEDLQSQIDNMSGGSLNEKVVALEKTVAALQKQIDELTSGGNTADVAALTKKVTALEGTVSALQSVITSLQESLTASGEDITGLTDQIAALTLSVESLTEELETAKTAITILQGKVDGDPNKVYKLGETVSYSSNGIKLFEVTLDSVFVDEHGSRYVLYSIKPFNLPYLKLSSFFDVKVQNIDTLEYFKTNENFPSLDILTENKITIKHQLFMNEGNQNPNFAPLNSKVFFGILVSSISDHGIIPFAIFDTSLPAV